MLLTISPNQPQLIQLRSVFITVNACVSQHLLQTADKNTLIFLVCLDMIFFLVADTQLYESLCRSVGPLVCPSVSTSRKVGKLVYPPLPTRQQLVAVYPALFFFSFYNFKCFHPFCYVTVFYISGHCRRAPAVLHVVLPPVIHLTVNENPHHCLPRSTV